MKEIKIQIKTKTKSNNFMISILWRNFYSTLVPVWSLFTEQVVEYNIHDIIKQSQFLTTSIACVLYRWSGIINIIFCSWLFYLKKKKRNPVSRIDIKLGMADILGIANRKSQITMKQIVFKFLLQSKNKKKYK